MRKKNLFIISTLVLVSSAWLFGSVNKRSAEFNIKGDKSLDISDAEVDMNYMKRIKIWHIFISTPANIYKKNGKKGTVHLFFSKNFDLKPGTYPIAFSYLNRKNTMGATFFYRENKKRTDRYTHDTKGDIIFTKVGDIIEGNFIFNVYSRDKTKGSVNVTGKFKLPKKAGFPNLPGDKNS